jgi:two-component sensor histidine kinase
VSLKQDGANKIAGQGMGLPSGFATNHSNKLGLQPIKLFSQQLDGNLFFINKNGLEINLNFTPE